MGAERFFWFDLPFHQRIRLVRHPPEAYCLGNLPEPKHAQLAGRHGGAVLVIGYCPALC